MTKVIRSLFYSRYIVLALLIVASMQQRGQED